MKKILFIGIAIIAVLYFLFSQEGETISIRGYRGTIKDVSGNTIELVSGLYVKLIGVEDGRTDVEMFIRNNFIGKSVTLIPDSNGDQEIFSENDAVGAYVILDENHQCLNRVVVVEYPKAFVQTELTDSAGWVTNKKIPEIKKDLALYMKQRTFLLQVQTPQGISTGTGFFINEDGLAITNWHVLPAGAEDAAVAFLYKENPDDSKIYSDKKRRIKNILWSEDTDGMDISIFSVDLENNEKVAYFDIAERRAVVGRNCATFGNPLGVYTASYSAGHISAFREDKRSNRTVVLMQYEMSTNGGNSGGPVCDDNGQIIAVHELGVKAAQGINFGIDIVQVRSVLEELGFKYGGK